MKIALAFESKLARQGIAELLRGHGFTIAQELSCGQLEDIEELRADVDVIAMNIDDFDRAEPADLIRKLRKDSPDLKIVLIGGAHCDHDRLKRCMNSGAHGFITDDAPPDALAQYMNLASQGLTAIPSAGWRDDDPSGGDPPAEASTNFELSGRERCVLVRIARGDPNKVIARSLDISESTVKAHMKSILRKIGVRNRTQAAIWAFNHGLVGADPVGCSASSAERPAV